VQWQERRRSCSSSAGGRWRSVSAGSELLLAQQRWA
jgi:hypothetical protein